MATTSSEFGAMAETAGEQAGNYAAQTMGQARGLYKTSREYVEHNPEKGVAIAAAIGVVFGGLLSMTIMRSR